MQNQARSILPIDWMLELFCS